MYWPSVTISNLDSTGSSLNSTALAAMQGDFDTARTQLETDNLPMYLLHRGGTVPPTHVIDLHLEPLLATQSRRLRKVAHR